MVIPTLINCDSAIIIKITFILTYYYYLTICATLCLYLNGETMNMMYSQQMGCMRGCMVIIMLGSHMCEWPLRNNKENNERHFVAKTTTFAQFQITSLVQWINNESTMNQQRKERTHSESTTNQQRSNNESTMKTTNQQRINNENNESITNQQWNNNERNEPTMKSEWKQRTYKESRTKATNQQRTSVGR